MSRFAFLSAASLSLVASAGADPLLEMMNTMSDDGPRYAYETSFAWDGIDATAKVDPSQPVGERIKILSPAESEWSKAFRQELEERDESTDGDIWCTEFGQMVPMDASVSDESDTTVTYAFTPVPEPDADRNEQKMMKQLDGTVMLDKADGAVLAFKMSLPKPYKPAMVAKINAFEMDVTCARSPDGRTFIEKFNFDISGSAMMQSFEESVSRRITNLLGPVD